jgi:hypothetical protein
VTGVVAAFAALLAPGAHAVIPARLAHRPAGRRPWVLAALPHLMAALVAVVGWLRLHPDPLLGVGWGTDPLTTLTGRSALLLVAALALADLLALLAFRRFGAEATAWRWLSVFAVPALAAGSLFLEIVRVGHGPRTTAGALALAASCRGAAALGAGEALAPCERPLWTLAAGLLLPLYPLALPGAIREMLIAEGGLFPLAAAAILFLVARWLPPRLWRPAVLAAAALTAFLLAGTTDLAGRFPVYMEPLPVL